MKKKTIGIRCSPKEIYFCISECKDTNIEIINIDNKDAQSRIRIRKRVHILISLLLLVVIFIFKAINDESVIKALFVVAGYTYGPLLGLYSFGLFTHIKLKDKYVIPICILAPLLSFLLKKYAYSLFNGYEIGFELLIINGLFTFLGLLCIGKYRSKSM